MKLLATALFGVFVFLCVAELRAEEATHYVGVESEFIRPKFDSGSTKHRLRVVGIWGIKPRTGLEVFLTYGNLQRAGSLGDGIDTRLFSAGLGVRRAHNIKRWLDFYHTLSVGVVDSAKNTRVFFQPKIGFTPHITSRLSLDVNLAWTIQTFQTHASMEQPFSVGLKFQI